MPSIARVAGNLVPGSPRPTPFPEPSVPSRKRPAAVSPEARADCSARFPSWEPSSWEVYRVFLWTGDGGRRGRPWRRRGEGASASGGRDAHAEDGVVQERVAGLGRGAVGERAHPAELAADLGGAHDIADVTRGAGGRRGAAGSVRPGAGRLAATAVGAVLAARGIALIEEAQQPGGAAEGGIPPRIASKAARAVGGEHVGAANHGIAAGRDRARRALCVVAAKLLTDLGPAATAGKRAVIETLRARHAVVVLHADLSRSLGPRRDTHSLAILAVHEAGLVGRAGVGGP